MDQISYQNGFICGLATRGLTRSGNLYEPIIYNDSGVYTYFYIDFRRAMSAFSMGMLTESIIVYDSTQINITNFAKVNETIYKIYANIAGLPHGLTVINKKTSRLKFANGDALPPFSTHMFISGQAAYIDGGYFCDNLDFPLKALEGTMTVNLNVWEPLNEGELSESASISLLSGVTFSETPTIVLY